MEEKDVEIIKEKDEKAHVKEDVEILKIKDEKKSIKDKVKNIDKNKLLDNKAFIVTISIIIGCIIMYVLLISINGGSIKKVSTENVKTTTLEETSDLKTGISNVYESTVYIEVTGQRSSSSGSGFVYKKDDSYGYILTNYHVIEDGNKFTVTFTNGQEAEATYVNGDEYLDIAILKVDKSNITLVATLGSSSSVELGDSVFTVGSPLGKEYMGTITKGIISGVNRMVSISLSSGSYSMEVLQTDASLNSGNSGGPICNIKGEVIGITSSKLVSTGVEGMGFAIPIDSVTSILDSMESGESIQRPYIGVQLADLSNTFALQYYYNIKISDDITFGAVVSYVEDNGDASKAGFEIGDVIIELDGEKVDTVSKFKYILYKHKVSDKLKVKYYRNNKIEETTLELTQSVKSE